MSTVTKRELTATVAKKVNLSQVEVGAVLNSLLEEIKAQYKNGNRVELRGFGTFFPYFRKSRTYKDPVTKAEKKMEDKHMLKFRSSQQLFIL